MTGATERRLASSCNASQVPPFLVQHIVEIGYAKWFYYNLWIEIK